MAHFYRLLTHIVAQTEAGQLPGDPTNNQTKWILLGVGGITLIGMGVGLMGWKKRLERQQDKSDLPAGQTMAQVPTEPPTGTSLPALQAPPTAPAPPATPPVGDTPLLTTTVQQATGPARPSVPPVADHTPLPAPSRADPLNSGTPPAMADPQAPSALRPEEATQEPVWDDRQGCYVQWDPVASHWLVFDQITQAWRVKN